MHIHNRVGRIQIIEFVIELVHLDDKVGMQFVIQMVYMFVIELVYSS